MKNIQKHKIFLSILLLGVYVFMALFASNFHNHDSGLVFKNFHFKKTEKSVTQSEFSKEFTDCLSCHVFHEGKNLVPKDFSIHFFQENYFFQHFFTYQQQFFNVQYEVLTLRGPPVFI